MSSATHDGRDTRRRALSIALAFAALCAAASILAINPYRYGVADHALTIPFLKQWIDPGLYPGDYIVGEKHHLYSLLWPALAYVVRLTGVEISTLFFVGYVLSIWATFVAIGALTRGLGGPVSAELLAMFIAVFAKPELAGTATIEDSFLTRVVAQPITLFALAKVVQGQHLRAWMLLGLAFVVHPLTAIYAAAMAAAAGLYALTLGHHRPMRVLTPSVAFLLIASPILIWKASDPVALPFFATTDWLALLELRSPHHISALSWSPILYLATAALVAVLFACAPKQDPVAERRHRFLLALAAGTLLLCATEIVSSVVLPISTIVQLQLFRSTVFLAHLAIAAYACWVVRARDAAPTGADLAIAWLIGFAVLYDAEAWPFALGALAIVIALAGAHLRLRGRWAAPSTFGVALGVLLLGLSLGAARTHPGAALANGQPSAWLEVQRWARDATPRDAVFIVPPGHDGFRVESERAIYGDWKDGTQAFFNLEVGREWLRRMQRLGYRSSLPVRGLNGMDALDNAYRHLDREELGAIAEETGGRDVYLVDFVGLRRLPGDAAYHNERYEVFRVLGESPR